MLGLTCTQGLQLRTFSAVVPSLAEEVLFPYPPVSLKVGKISYQNHSIPYWICVSARMCYITLWHACMFFFPIKNLWNLKKKCRGFFQVMSRLPAGSLESRRVSPRLLIELLQSRGASALSAPICLSGRACRPRLDEVQADGWRCELRYCWEILGFAPRKAAGVGKAGHRAFLCKNI